jgi:hypothetical protein
MLHGAIIEIDDDGGHQRLEVPSRIASEPALGIAAALVRAQPGILEQGHDLLEIREILLAGPGTEPQTAWDGATIANGIGWSPDGDLAYWNDTPRRGGRRVRAPGRGRRP